jgi:hypothetical protein
MGEFLWIIPRTETLLQGSVDGATGEGTRFNSRPQRAAKGKRLEHASGPGRAKDRVE